MLIIGLCSQGFYQLFFELFRDSYEVSLLILV